MPQFCPVTVLVQSGLRIANSITSFKQLASDTLTLGSVASPVKGVTGRRRRRGEEEEEEEEGEEEGEEYDDDENDKDNADDDRDNADGDNDD